ncbi:MAG: T9SS type A sorting domain-containing protein [Flavobacterium sp.]|nr:T9SS type A sorting domain-containing protein [Flavobacterium sp.]
MKKTTLSAFSGKARMIAATSLLFTYGLGHAQLQYINGNLSTGATSKSGIAAPSGYTWSELQNDAGVMTMSNGTTGVGAQMVNTTMNRVADDFTVPAGESWTISKATFYAYQTGYMGTVSPFTDIRVRISSGNPSQGGSTVVFGDLTTNRLLSTSDAMMYRTGNSVAPAPGSVPATNRKIWKIEATVAVTLQPGTYWIEWTQDAGTGGNFSPPSTIVDARTVAGYNAIQFQSAAATWVVLVDSGNPPDTTPDVAVDMPFVIDYSMQLGVNDRDIASTISIFPNPVTNLLNVSSSTVMDSYKLYDVSGRLVKSAQLSGSAANQIDVSSLMSGSYILKLKSGDETVTRKFIKS